MCVRYKLKGTEAMQGLGKWASVGSSSGNPGGNGQGADDQLQGDRDVFPGRLSPILLIEEEVRTLAYSSFGLWANWYRADLPESKKKPYHNAKGETVHELYSFRDAFKYRRCVAIVSSFEEQLGGGKWIEVSRKDEQRILIAGIYNNPNSRCTSKSHALITTVPNSLISTVHDRMPVILSENQIDDWLDPLAKQEYLLAMLQPCLSEILQIREYEEERKRKPKQDSIDFDDLS